MKKPYKNKVVVITGGSSGIGKELVNNFDAAGARVVLLSRTNPEGRKNFVACDLTGGDALRASAERIRQEYGKIDLLIHNAGMGISGATELLPEEEIRKVMELDYFAVLNLTKELLPVMAEKSKIVVISSACALFALPFRSVYCSAKAAVSMFAYGLRMELSNTGINVVCVCPGDIKSNFTANRLKFADTNSRYGARVTRAANKVDSREEKRMPLSKSGKKIFKICAYKNKALYIVGAKYKFLNVASRILTTNAFLKLTDKLFGGK